MKFRTKGTKMNAHTKKKGTKNVEVQTEASNIESAQAKTRTELVLLEAIHRLKLLDLKKQLEKEKILLKRRRKNFRMGSSKPKVKINKEYQEKLNEWKLLHSERKLRSAINGYQKDISKIQSELEQYRTELNGIVKTIGRAHDEAISHEDEEDIVDELIKQRDKKFRAELLLLEEIHRLKLLDLKKQLVKEKTPKRRREIFSMISTKPKVKINKEYQKKLNEWKLLQSVLEKEKNQLKKQLEESDRTKNLEPSTEDLDQMKFRTKGTKVNAHTKKKGTKNVEVQTEANNIESGILKAKIHDYQIEIAKINSELDNAGRNSMNNQIVTCMHNLTQIGQNGCKLSSFKFRVCRDMKTKSIFETSIASCSAMAADFLMKLILTTLLLMINQKTVLL
uniref:Uncharacterized protein n=1 Tax=Tetranychus urticae TaxID=32264 RepID=T1KKY9_TETUR